jgi:hypothetical protein
MTTEEKIISAVGLIKTEAHTKGFRDAHERYRALASIIPSSITKGQLIELIKRTVKSTEIMLAPLESALKQYDH